MKTNKDLTVAQLKGHLHYDPDTGIFTRRHSRSGKRAGSVAGTDSAAYLKVKDEPHPTHMRLRHGR
jgi:hypothetical protein